MGHVRPASSTAAAGSAPDFDTFFAIEYRRLFEVLYLLTRDRAEAEDLAQEAMARAYERWSGIRDPTRYVYRTAFNLHRTLRRRLAVAVRKRAQLLPPADHPDAVERRLDVLAALALLPVTQRAVVVLVDWAGSPRSWWRRSPGRCAGGRRRCGTAPASGQTATAARFRTGAASCTQPAAHLLIGTGIVLAGIALVQRRTPAPASTPEASTRELGGRQQPGRAAPPGPPG
jgi:Sigma-70 region 2